VSHLIAGHVARATRPRWLSDESNGEAALSVYKTDNPAELDQSFLLISCTRHIVTVSPTWDGTRSAGFSGVPAYGQMLTARLPVRRAAIYLRHFCYISTSRWLGRFSSAQLSMSPWRSDHIFTSPHGRVFSVWPLRILSSRQSFLLIVRTRRIFTVAPTCAPNGVLGTVLVARDSRMSQHIAEFCNSLYVDRYSYGRRLPGLSFAASNRSPNNST
jgi:hypothetical protein